MHPHNNSRSQGTSSCRYHRHHPGHRQQQQQNLCATLSQCVTTTCCTSLNHFREEKEESESPLTQTKSGLSTSSAAHYARCSNDDTVTTTCSNESQNKSHPTFQSFLNTRFYQRHPPCRRRRQWTNFILFILIILLSCLTSNSLSQSNNNNNNYYYLTTNYDAGIMHRLRALPPSPTQHERTVTTAVDSGDSLTSWTLPTTTSVRPTESSASAEARSAIGTCNDNESCVFSWVCEDIGKPVRFCSGPFFYFTVCCRSKEATAAATQQHAKKRQKSTTSTTTTTTTLAPFNNEEVIEIYEPPEPATLRKPISSSSSSSSSTTSTSTTSSTTSTTTAASSTSTSTEAALLLLNMSSSGSSAKPTRTTLLSTTLPSIINIQSPSTANFLSSSSTTTTLPSAISSSTLSARTCGQAPLVFRNSRIVGGGDTQYGALTYQAMVVIKGQERCGGALLDNQWVVTGGHCVAPQSVTADDILVKLGEWDRSHDNELFPRVERRVKKFVLHPLYGKERSFANDIALLKLDSPVEYQPHIQPACLPEQPDEDFTGLYGTVSGWGRLNFRENRPDILQFVEVPIMSNTQCESMFKKQDTPEHIIDQMMCAGYDEGGRDACQGDSGGPMALRKEGSWTLIGIVSWGYGCGLPGYPGVYTRVSKFSDWLVQIMWNDRD